MQCWISTFQFLFDGLVFKFNSISSLSEQKKLSISNKTEKGEKECPQTIRPFLYPSFSLSLSPYTYFFFFTEDQKENHNHDPIVLTGTWGL